MGVLEWLLTLLAATAGVAVFGGVSPPAQRPVPWGFVLLAAVASVCLMVQALFTGPLVMEALLGLRDTGWTFYDPTLAARQDHGGVRIVMFATVGPWLLAIGWALVVRRWQAALAVGAASWAALLAGAGTAVVLGMRVLLPYLTHSDPNDPILLDAASLVETLFLWAGGCGALFAAALVAAVDDAPSARWASLMAPGLTLWVGAMATPPDLLSQLLAVAGLLLCWGVGLGTGHGLGRLRRAHPGPPRGAVGDADESTDQP